MTAMNSRWKPQVYPTGKKLIASLCSGVPLGESEDLKRVLRRPGDLWLEMDVRSKDELYQALSAVRAAAANRDFQQIFVLLKTHGVKIGEEDNIAIAGDIIPLSRLIYETLYDSGGFPVVVFASFDHKVDFSGTDLDWQRFTGTEPFLSDMAALVGYQEDSHASQASLLFREVCQTWPNHNTLDEAFSAILDNTEDREDLSVFESLNSMQSTMKI